MYRLFEKIYLSVKEFLEENKRTREFFSAHESGFYREELDFLGKHSSLLEEVLEKLEDNGPERA